MLALCKGANAMPTMAELKAALAAAEAAAAAAVKAAPAVATSKGPDYSDVPAADIAKVLTAAVNIPPAFAVKSSNGNVQFAVKLPNGATLAAYINVGTLAAANLVDPRLRVKKEKKAKNNADPLAGI